MSFANGGFAPWTRLIFISAFNLDRQHRIGRKGGGDKGELGISGSCDNLEGGQRQLRQQQSRHGEPSCSRYEALLSDLLVVATAGL